MDNIKGVMGRRFVMGDIHGAHKALLQCLERSHFNNDHDLLIFLGDASDGWPESKLVFDELLRIKNLIYIFGNHDFWTLEWMQQGTTDDMWLHQGGKATVESYRNGVPDDHITLLNQSSLYHVIENKLFVHAGIETDVPIDVQSMSTLLWDRSLAKKALLNYYNNVQQKLTLFDEVYLGHTPVSPTPLLSGDIWLMDTGAGWTGCLSMMDIDTKEIYQSDPVPSLYPGIAGRTRK